MRFRRLAVDGAREFSPPASFDDRGHAVQVFQAKAFIEATGRPLFRVAQTLNSSSRRGVIRGVHFTTAPPGGAKYVSCVQGAALDMVIDIRIGSPTFGKWDAVRMDQQDFRAMYLPAGVGHAFVAFEDDTIMSYLLSSEYVPENELTVTPLDPRLGLPIPPGLEPIMSERDRMAITFAEAETAGLLPNYTQCQAIEAAGGSCG